ncbi:hypothetical protein BH23BAC3_BH23BAC3_13950 [soil metagenome]
MTFSRIKPTNPDTEAATPTINIARVSFPGEMVNNGLYEELRIRYSCTPAYSRDIPNSRKNSEISFF